MVELAADLLDRAALRLDPEEGENKACLPAPESQKQQRREERIERHLRGDVIGRADDQGEPEGTDDLAEITNAVAEAHAARAQSVWPYLSQVRPDARVAGIAEEALDHNQHKKHRHGAEVDVVPITGEGHADRPSHPNQAA